MNPESGSAAFVTGHQAGKRHRQLVALRRAIALGEHAHDLGNDYAKCWNGDSRCPVWRIQGGEVHDRP